MTRDIARLPWNVFIDNNSITFASDAQYTMSIVILHVALHYDSAENESAVTRLICDII